MTPDELERKIDDAVEKGFGLCSNPKEYTDLLKIVIEYYATRKSSSGEWGKALETKGAGNGR